MDLSCPHCRNPIQVVDDWPEPEVLCPTCGSSIQTGRHPTATWPRDQLPTLGKFQLLEEVGRGAFGIVFRARDVELGRIVAVKIPRHEKLVTADDEDRFMREGRAAAGLRHPGIVPIYEVGRAESLVFIVSEFVEGTTLADLLTSRLPSFREAADFVAQAAVALDAAHHQGVVHRDVKPSNLMVSRSEDGEPRRIVRLMDFGLARRNEGEITLTLDGQVLGTPAYMSPELARGEGRQVDGRSDVYSLGVILYRLLVGELPFRGNSRMLLSQVLHDEPKAPRQSNDRIPRDLETIALKCLQKDPARRFQSAAALAADLRHWLAGEPVCARPVSQTEKLWRWCRRKPLIASLTVVVALLFLAVGLASGVGYVATTEASAAAAASRDDALTASQGLMLARDREQMARRQTQVQLAKSQLDHALNLLDQGELRFGMAELLRAWQTMPSEETQLDHCIRTNLSLWSYYQPLQRSWKHRGLVSHLDLDRKARFVAVCGGNVVVRDLSTGEQAAPAIDVKAQQAFLSPDGERLLTISRDEDYVAQLWDWKSGTELKRLMRSNRAILDAQFSPDGSILAIASVNEGHTLWNGGTGERLEKQFESSGAGWCLAFDADGKRLATGSDAGGGKVRIWDLATRRPLTDAMEMKSYPAKLAFSPSGDMIAAAGYRGDNSAYVWDASSGNRLFEPLQHEGTVSRLVFDPAGKRLLTASNDRTARLWDLATGKQISESFRHDEIVTSVDFNFDGSKFLTAGLDGIVRIWDAQSLQLTGPGLLHGDLIRVAEFHPQKDELFVGGYDGFLTEWNVAHLPPKRVAMPAPWRLWTLVYSPDLKRLAAGMNASRTYLYDTTTGDRIHELVGADTAMRCAFSNDGDVIATAGRSWLNLWSGDGESLGKPLKVVNADASVVWALALSPDGRTLLTGDVWAFQLWDVETLEPRGPEWSSAGRVSVAVFTRDGKSMITDLNGQSLQMRDVSTSQPIGPPLTHRMLVRSNAFSRDGRLFAAGGRGVHWWQIPEGKPAGSLASHKQVVSLSFSSDAKTMAAGYEDGNVQLWDLATERPLGPPLPQATTHRDKQSTALDVVIATAFASDDRQLLTSSGTYWRGGIVTQNRWVIPAPLEGARSEVSAQIRKRLGMEMVSRRADGSLKVSPPSR